MTIFPLNTLFTSSPWIMTPRYVLHYGTLSFPTLPLLIHCSVRVSFDRMLPSKKATALLGNDGKKALIAFPTESLDLHLLLPPPSVAACTLRLVILRLYLYVILLHPKKRPSDQVV